jgi:hypothetical protein
MHALSALFVLVGCGGGGTAEVTGTVAGHQIGEIKTAMHGGPFIVLLDSEVDCIDLAWVDTNYQDGASPAPDLSFAGVQFQFAEAPLEGTFSVYGDSTVLTYGYDNNGESFSVEGGRDGTLTIDEVSDDVIVGSFDVTYVEGSATGTFETEYCRNLRP